jgi:hypothetical protein
MKIAQYAVSVNFDIRCRIVGGEKKGALLSI